MAQEVYFLPWKRKDELYSFLKAAKIFEHVKARNFLAIKIHFGEEYNKGYIKPEYVSPVVKIIMEKTAYPFLTDASTIYIGKRSDAYHHLLIANKHGFTIDSCGCPIIIADGLRGNVEQKIKVNLKHFKTVTIAQEIYNADSFIFMNHFKGHEITGFGGALKNIGMGCGSKVGKYAMHNSSKPTINNEHCIGCGNCVRHCYQKALSLVYKKVVMDKEKCAGCGQCIVSCAFKVFGLKWNKDSSVVQEKIIEYVAGVLKNKSGTYISFLNHISKYCDCFSLPKNDSLMDDVGIVAGVDPVAVDQASYDLVNKAFGKNFFKKIYPEIDPTIQLKYAEELGLGTRNYKLTSY
ncbi:4Fe-4S ferredoxin [Endomicrobiia bacterium]|nr:4Fe-4S ferredoxin [Endomicrobiia bacterium]